MRRGGFANWLQGPAIVDGRRGRARCRFGGRPSTRWLAGNFARCHRAHDVRLHDQVSGTADHQKMFDIVATDQDQTPTSVNGCRIDDGQPGLSTPRCASETICSEAPHQPCGHSDQGQHNQEGNKKSGGQRHFRAKQALTAARHN
jgi:hypothetical protein